MTPEFSLQEDWLEEFEKYKQSPEFKYTNFNKTMQILSGTLSSCAKER